MSRPTRLPRGPANGGSNASLRADGILKVMTGCDET